MTTTDFSLDLARGVRTLSRRDAMLRPLVRQHGYPTIQPHTDYFDSLVRAIISQQISGRAADSILRRSHDLLGSVFLPDAILMAADTDLRACGVSPQKLGYLRSLAAAVNEGTLHLDSLKAMADEEIVAELISIKGIGRWTAQMFLIFSLGRLDILPTGDFGVQKGLRISLDLPELPTPRAMEAIAEERRWQPYRSIASWYMWRVLE